MAHSARSLVGREDLGHHTVLLRAGIKLSSVRWRATSSACPAKPRSWLSSRESAAPELLADLAKGVLRKKLPVLKVALEGRFGSHYALLVAQILAKLDFLDEAVANLSAEIGPPSLGRAISTALMVVYTATAG